MVILVVLLKALWLSVELLVQCCCFCFFIEVSEVAEVAAAVAVAIHVGRVWPTNH